MVAPRMNLPPEATPWGRWMQSEVQRIGDNTAHAQGSVDIVGSSITGLASSVASTINAVSTLTAGIVPGGSQVTDWNTVQESGSYYSANANNDPNVDTGLTHLATEWTGVVTRYDRADGTFSVKQTLSAAWSAIGMDRWTRWGYYDDLSVSPVQATWSSPWEPDYPTGGLHGQGDWMANYSPAYWEMWDNTTDGNLYIGASSNMVFRRFSGTATSAAVAWDTVSGTTCARAITFTLPTVLEANENIAATLLSGGTGLTFIGGVSVTRGTTNTTLVINFMQLLSTTTQPCTISWQISRDGA